MRLPVLVLVVFLTSTLAFGCGSASPAPPTPIPTTNNISFSVTNDMSFTMKIGGQTVTGSATGFGGAGSRFAVDLPDGDNSASGTLNGKGSFVLQFSSGTFSSVGVIPFSISSLSGPFQSRGNCYIVYENPSTSAANFSFSFRSGFSTTANVC